MLKRFNVDTEKAVTYMEKALDRQLNKARGLLTFNSILVAALRVQEGQTYCCWNNIGSIFAIVSCLPLLLMLWVVWGSNEDYSETVKDFDRLFALCCKRAYRLSFSILASIVATGIALACAVCKLHLPWVPMECIWCK
jgi:hypothetical protein